MGAITYNGSDDEAWHKFEEIPIVSTHTLNGVQIEIMERHNPNKWNIFAAFTNKGDTKQTTISFHLQKDFPFKIFSVDKPSKQTPRNVFGHTKREYGHIPEKYQEYGDLFMQIINERIKESGDSFVCGIITWKEHVLPSYVNPSIIPVYAEV